MFFRTEFFVELVTRNGQRRRYTLGSEGTKFSKYPQDCFLKTHKKVLKHPKGAFSAWKTLQKFGY